jgi:hypothetical protein
MSVHPLESHYSAEVRIAGTTILGNSAGRHCTIVGRTVDQNPSMAASPVPPRTLG